MSGQDDSHREGPRRIDDEAKGQFLAAVKRGACGIIVLADLTIAGLRPEGWARRVADAAELWQAQRIVAGKNQGGDMVESVWRGGEAGSAAGDQGALGRFVLYAASLGACHPLRFCEGEHASPVKAPLISVLYSGAGFLGAGLYVSHILVRRLWPCE